MIFNKNEGKNYRKPYSAKSKDKWFSNISKSIQKILRLNHPNTINILTL